MKFSIFKNYLIKHIDIVSKAISSKTPIPILSGIKLELNQAGLSITGSNSDISIQTFISSDENDSNLLIEEEGEIVVPARIFYEIIKSLPGKDILITADEKNMFIEIKSGKSVFKINGNDANLYPHLSDITSENQFVLNSQKLKKLINRVVFAVSNQEIRPILTGVHFIISDEKLTAIATDSHRLAQYSIDLEGIKNKKYDFVLPGKSLIELSHILNDNIKSITMRIGENQILFIIGQTYFYSQLLQGKYPSTVDLIPNSSNIILQVYADKMLLSIERASLMSHAGHNNVVRLVLNKDNATLFSNSPEIGNVEENIDFESLNGDDLDISFNPDYMKDALRNLGHVLVNIGFTAPLRPFLIKIKDDNSYIQLITPIRTI